MMKVFIICLIIVSAFVYAAHIKPESVVIAKVDSSFVKVPDKNLIVQTAVMQVESRGNPSVRRFEPHIFKRLTGRSASTFREASKINWRAAMKASSIGLFQILGTNCSKAGYKDIVEMFHADSLRQIDGFWYFLHNQGLDSVLLQGRIKAFARGYNGKNFKANKYDDKLSSAICKLYLEKK